jgi:hypothetical protein
VEAPIIVEDRLWGVMSVPSTTDRTTAAENSSGTVYADLMLPPSTVARHAFSF